jgi:hypothetical protein
MADDTAELLRRGFSGNLPAAICSRSAGSCARSPTALAMRQHSALPATARARSRLA